MNAREGIKIFLKAALHKQLYILPNDTLPFRSFSIDHDKFYCVPRGAYSQYIYTFHKTRLCRLTVVEGQEVKVNIYGAGANHFSIINRLMILIEELALVFPDLDFNFEYVLTEVSLDERGERIGIPVFRLLRGKLERPFFYKTNKKSLVFSKQLPMSERQRLCQGDVIDGNYRSNYQELEAAEL